MLLQQHKERQKTLHSLFSPELRAIRMSFLKSIWQMVLVFTCVFWISISFLYGTGYDPSRHMKAGTVVFRNLDDSEISRTLSSTFIKQFDIPTMPKLFDYTQRSELATKEEIRKAVWDGDFWIGVVINEGFGQNLTRATRAGRIRHYFKVAAVTKAVTGALAALEAPFAQLVFQNAIKQSGTSAATILERANPQALVLPFSNTVVNIAPYHFDLSMYILTVSMSLCMVTGAFVPSNMWKTIEEPFFKQLRIPQIIALRFVINMISAVVITMQVIGIIFVFSGPTWDPNAKDFFALYGLILLNTLCFTFFIECMQSLVHPRFLLGGYFITLMVNIGAGLFGAEMNNRFFRIIFAFPFFNTGISIRTLLTDGSYKRWHYTITVNVVIAFMWWVISLFLIARKARLVRAGKMLMSNIAPVPGTVVQHDGDEHGDDAQGKEGVARELKSLSPSQASTATSASASSADLSVAENNTTYNRRRGEPTSDIEIEDM
ncbi:hypothetical protein BX661DRAFT_188940 [Kickxella alabastrina]|uniref:uncharacterized protein n=1 Tax=Kickxella alabastrina TaxID=61397 RepID=UPI00221FF245|nr:uncharacterized protein BX661DRAFT_188940 [Kickxella alabastrina]KAI7820753.1 hypothetical protein BX661DRAFT_188940 [Kickxella alabastrina]